MAALLLVTPGPEGQALAGDKIVASVNSRLVLVPVTVIDRNGKPAVDLEREHFSVTEDSQPREIASLTREEAPIGLGLVVDLSGSMNGKLKQAISATRAIADLAGAADEVFLMTFGDRILPPSLKSIGIYAVYLLVVFIRPRGLFGSI